MRDVLGRLRILASVTIIAMLSILGACRDDASEIQRGFAATFEVTTEGALISIYAENTHDANIVVDDADGARVTRVHVVLDDIEVGFLGTGVLTGLESDVPYSYRVQLGSTQLGPYHFRTAPSADADSDVYFVYSADIDISPEFESPIFETLAASDADFMLTLGDWPYADNFPASETLSEYRTRHREVREPERIQHWLRALPIYATWDDHEALNNWDGRLRAENPERIANAVTSWDEWFPLRTTMTGESRRYRSWRWGRHAEFFVLDTRLYRSDNSAPDGPDKTMLGAEQRQWFIDAVIASEATFKVVVTSIPIARGRGVDTWASFIYERDLILTELAVQGVSGLVFLAGDSHRFAAHRLPDWGLREFMVGPLARHPAASTIPPTPVIVAQAEGYNFGEIRIQSTGPDGAPILEFVCRDATGMELYRERLQAGDLVLATPPL